MNVTRSPKTMSALLLSVLCFPALAVADPSFVDDGSFSVCVDPTFPPMEYMKSADDTAPVGVDADVATALAAQWKVPVKFATMDFAGLLPSLSAARCDAVISGIMLTDERQKSFDGVGYLNTFVVVIGSGKTKAFASAEALSGKTIAVQAGTTYLTRIEAISADLVAKGLAPIAVQQYPKQTDAMQQLEVGRVDGVLTQDTEVSYRNLQKPGQFATLWRLPQDKPEPFAIYIRKDSVDRAALVEALAALKSSGSLEAITKTWSLSSDQLVDIK